LGPHIFTEQGPWLKSARKYMMNAAVASDGVAKIASMELEAGSILALHWMETKL